MDDRTAWVFRVSTLAMGRSLRQKSSSQCRPSLVRIISPFLFFCFRTSDDSTVIITSFDNIAFGWYFSMRYCTFHCDGPGLIILCLATQAGLRVRKNTLPNLHEHNDNRVPENQITNLLQ